MNFGLLVVKLKQVISWVMSNWRLVGIIMLGACGIIVAVYMIAQIHAAFTRPETSVVHQSRPVDYAGDKGYESCQFSSNISDPEERHAYCVNFATANN